MGDQSRNVLTLRTEHIEELEATPVVAAETVVTRHLKVVDEFGTVRIDATVREDGVDGPWIRLYGQDGDTLVSLSVEDEVQPTGKTMTCLYLWGGGSDQVASLQSGGMRGPSLDLEAPLPPRGGDGPVHLELLAGKGGAAFVVAHGPGSEKTIMQLTPGEEPATFVDGDEQESA